MPIPPQFSGDFPCFNPSATTSAKSRKHHPARHAHWMSSARAIEIPCLFVRGCLRQPNLAAADPCARTQMQMTAA
jgi:hypothetical protein